MCARMYVQGRTRVPVCPCVCAHVFMGRVHTHTYVSKGQGHAGRSPLCAKTQTPGKQLRACCLCTSFSISFRILLHFGWHWLVKVTNTQVPGMRFSDSWPVVALCAHHPDSVLFHHQVHFQSPGLCTSNLIALKSGSWLRGRRRLLKFGNSGGLLPTRPELLGCGCLSPHCLLSPAPFLCTNQFTLRSPKPRLIACCFENPATSVETEERETVRRR